MRSTKTTGSRTAAGVVILVSAVAIGLSGCSGGGRSDAAKPPGGPLSGTGASPLPTGTASGATPSSPPASSAEAFVTDPATTLVAPEFRRPAAWSSPVSLAAGPLAGFGSQTPGAAIPGSQPGAPENDGSLMSGQARFGMVAVAGNEVAVPEFGALGADSSSPSPAAALSAAALTVRFLDAKTGQTVASHPLPDAHQYYGMDAVTVGGKTDVEVRYSSAATTTADGQFTSVVLDPTGAQVWSSAGQPIAAPGTPSGSTGPLGLVGDRGTGFVHDGGYVERIDDPSPGDRTLANATISVLDLTGRTVLTVPKNNPRNQSDPIKSTPNNLQLAAGYAVVTTVDVPPPPSGGNAPDPTALMPLRFTIYDLAHNASKTASITEPAVPIAAGPLYGWGAVMATCGSKLLLQWPTITLRTTATGTLANLAVLDAATGQITAPPITLPTSMEGQLQTTLRATTDPSCSSVLVEGTIGVARPVALAVDWAHGRPLWKQVGVYPPTAPGPQISFQALTVRGGIAYGLRTVGTETQAATMGLSDGKVRESGFALSPVAFTASGAPLFLQIDPAAPPPLPIIVTTTPPGATSGQTVVTTTRPPATPIPTATQASPAPSGQYAMTIWAGAS